MCNFRFLLIAFSLLGVFLVKESSAGIADLLLPLSTVDRQNDIKPKKGRFLVSRRSLDDAHFGQSIVYLLDHGIQGTMGLIVNRSGGLSLLEAIPEITDQNAKSHFLYYGGPVGLPTIVMLANSELAIEGMRHVEGNIYISSDRSVLDDAISAGKDANQIRFFMGYSGWAPGQLDMEIAHESWHVVDIDRAEIFSDDIDTLWERLIDRLEPSGIQVDKEDVIPRLGGLRN